MLTIETPFHVETARLERDDGWVAEISDIPGVMAVAIDRDEAVTRAHALAFTVLAVETQTGALHPDDHAAWRRFGHDVIESIGDRDVRNLRELGDLLRREASRFAFVQRTAVMAGA